MKFHVVAAALTTLILAVHVTLVRCMPDRIQACGQELADILRNTCHRGYNTYYQSNADETLSNGTRKKRGITQECCKHSCSLKDILQYCSGGTPINATELLPVDQAPDRVRNSRAKTLKLFPNNKIDVDDDDEGSNDGSSKAPSMPPPPRLDQRADSTNTESKSQEPHANVTQTSSGIHSTAPWFRGKTPAIVVIIGQKFNLGSRIVPKSKNGPDSITR